MNIEHKKTALDDDSYLYQKRDDSFGKKDLSSLSGMEKLRYFLDYYSKQVIAIVIIVVIAAALLNQMVFNPSECVFSVAFLDESQITESEAAQDILTEIMAPENKNDYISIINYNLSDYQMEMAFVTQTMAGAIDVVICTQDYFENGCNQGMFMDLSEYLPEDTYTALSAKMLEGQTAETDEQGNILSYHDPKPYGIDLSGSTHFKELGGIEAKPILCVLGNSEHPENTMKCISYFTE